MKDLDATHIDYSSLNLKKPPFLNLNIDQSAPIVGLFFGVFVIISLFSINLAVGVLLASAAIGIYFGADSIGKYEGKKGDKLKIFAKTNGFEYQYNPGNVWGPGSLFKAGGEKSLTNMISGKFKDLPFRFYEYSYSKFGGNATDTNITVMDFTLPRKWPHMVIDSLVEPGEFGSSTLPIKFNRSQRIELEGDFSKYFGLYAPDTYGITALTILAPDVMEVIMRKAVLCDIEIIENKLYFYWPGVDVGKESYKNKFETTEAVLNEVSNKLVKHYKLAKPSKARIESTKTSSVKLKEFSAIPIVAAGILLFFVQPLLAVPLLLIYFIWRANDRIRLKKTLDLRTAETKVKR